MPWLKAQLAQDWQRAIGGDRCRMVNHGYAGWRDPAVPKAQTGIREPFDTAAPRNQRI